MLREWERWLTVIGLVLTLIGAGCATYGVWLSSDEAIRRDLLEQSYFAVGGFY